MTEPIDQATKESDCRKALQCLYIAVDEQVASDVDNKVSAYVYELKEKLKQERNKVIDECITKIKKEWPNIQKMKYQETVLVDIELELLSLKDSSHE